MIFTPDLVCNVKSILKYINLLHIYYYFSKMLTNKNKTELVLLYYNAIYQRIAKLLGI